MSTWKQIAVSVAITLLILEILSHFYELDELHRLLIIMLTTISVIFVIQDFRNKPK